MRLDFMVHEQTVEQIPSESVPRIGSQKYLSIRFLFSEDWDSLTRTVYFQHKDFSLPVVLDESGEVMVDDYFTAQGSFLITLVGADGSGTVVPTNVLCITMEDAGEAWTSVPPKPDVPAYAQLVALAASAKEQAEAAAASAREAADAKTGPQGPAGDSHVPTPSASDNGKVLRVVGGSPAWVSLPSASGVSF